MDFSKSIRECCCDAELDAQLELNFTIDKHAEGKKRRLNGVEKIERFFPPFICDESMRQHSTKVLGKMPLRGKTAVNVK